MVAVEAVVAVAEPNSKRQDHHSQKRRHQQQQQQQQQQQGPKLCRNKAAATAAAAAATTTITTRVGNNQQPTVALPAVSGLHTTAWMQTVPSSEQLPMFLPAWSTLTAFTFMVCAS
jgi:hypothetical protein